ncbi:DNA translocase FtsK [Camelliibacillus cellulosilyticus]|uniref:DNA translocase FtsK n=1 Tax=Camelliibacillus cellulosilyticus TaxID=2174486 RepID=UPI00366FE0D2
MSNWWKHFFGLDDDDPYELEDESENDVIHKKRRTTLGRFEYGSRPIEVKMIRQYPKTNHRAGSRFEQSVPKPHDYVNHKPAANNYDEPAYKRKLPKEGAVNSTKSGESRLARRRADMETESRESKNKKPFKPTEVPSPIFGYRRPHATFDSESQEPQKTSMRSEHIEPKTSILGNLESDDVRQAIVDRTDISDHGQSERGQRHANTPAEENGHGLFEHEGDMEETSSLQTTQESLVYPHPNTDQSAVGQDENRSLKEEPEEDGQESHREENDRPSLNNKGGSEANVPYNVLMFGADRRAWRHKSSSESIKLAAKESEDRSEWNEKRQRAKMKQPLSMDLLNNAPNDASNDAAWIAEKQQILKQTLINFHVKAEIVGHVQGPSVTRFEIRLHPGVKVNKVINLTEDIKLSMAAKQIRIAPVPGKNTVGIEVPNESRKPVFLKQLLSSDAYTESPSPLTAALGIDVSGRHIVTDLSKMPHGLIAGATGSGKSVCIHSLILSLIYKTEPDMLRLVLIDPKVVELAAYQQLPHLAAPVITQPKEAALALKWAVDEMERRYQAFAAAGVRDIRRFNQTAQDEKMPYIVIIIDELADLMMTSPQDVEEAICRIAQKARAAGIHMLLATQRPSVDVITGLIKSNIPTRIAFGVSSQADSRTILDSGGAERLLGQGDMLFVENGSRDMKRLQGAFVTDEEIDRITDALAGLERPAHLFEPSKLRDDVSAFDDGEDELFEEAARFVIDQGQASVSSLQRRFRIGYNRAARLIDRLEASDVISEANGSKPRQVLVSREGFERQMEGHGLPE